MRLGNDENPNNSGVAVLSKHGEAFIVQKLLSGSGQELLDPSRLVGVGSADPQLRREVGSK